MSNTFEDRVIDRIIQFMSDDQETSVLVSQRVQNAIMFTDLDGAEQMSDSQEELFIRIENGERVKLLLKTIAQLV